MLKRREKEWWNSRQSGLESRQTEGDMQTMKDGAVVFGPSVLYLVAVLFGWGFLTWDLHPGKTLPGDILAVSMVGNVVTILLVGFLTASVFLAGIADQLKRDQELFPFPLFRAYLGLVSESFAMLWTISIMVGALTSFVTLAEFKREGFAFLPGNELSYYETASLLFAAGIVAYVAYCMARYVWRSVSPRLCCLTAA